MCLYANLSGRSAINRKFIKLFYFALCVLMTSLSVPFVLFIHTSIITFWMRERNHFICNPIWIPTGIYQDLELGQVQTCDLYVLFSDHVGFSSLSYQHILYYMSVCTCVFISSFDPYCQRWNQFLAMDTAKKASKPNEC